jgi:hypothetical protein
MAMPKQVQKNVVNKPVIRGTPARGLSPGAVSQIGEALGNKVTEGGKLAYRGENYLVGKTPAGGAAVLGNAKALDVGKGGCGTGREVMARGSQSTYGSANPGQARPGANKPIFPGFK